MSKFRKIETSRKGEHIDYFAHHALPNPSHFTPKKPDDFNFLLIKIEERYLSSGKLDLKDA